MTVTPAAREIAQDGLILVSTVGSTAHGLNMRWRSRNDGE